VYNLIADTHNEHLLMTTISKPDLAKTLSILAPALLTDKTVLQPALTHFCFCGDAGVFSYDGVTFIISADSNFGFDGGVPGQLLLDLLPYLPEHISTTTVAPTGTVTFTGKGTKQTLALIPPDDFILDLPLQMKPDLSIDCDATFLDKLILCRSIVPTQTLIENRGVVTYQPGNGLLWATSGSALIRAAVGATKSKKTLNYLIPVSVIDQLAAVKSTTNTETLLLNFSEKHLVVRFEGGIKLVSKLVTVAPPNYQQVIDSLEKAPRAYHLPEGLRASLKKAKLLDETNSATTLTLDHASLEVNSNGSLGTLNDKHKIAAVASEVEATMSVRINPDLVLDMLEHANEIAFSERYVVLTNKDTGLLYIAATFA